MKNLLIATITILGCAFSANAQELKLELSIKSEYKEGVGKINVFTCDDGQLLVEFDENKCIAPDFIYCNKAAPRVVKSTLEMFGPTLFLTQNEATGEAVTLRQLNDTEFEIELRTNEKTESLKASLTSKLTPYPVNESCNN